MGIFVVIFAFATAIGLGTFLSLSATKNKKGLNPEGQSPLQKAFGTPLTDANVIQLASKYKDGISVAALCVKTDVSTKEVKKKLEELRAEGILLLEIGENGIEKYKVSDTSLLDDQ